MAVASATSLRYHRVERVAYFKIFGKVCEGRVKVFIENEGQLETLSAEPGILDCGGEIQSAWCWLHGQILWHSGFNSFIVRVQ